MKQNEIRQQIAAILEHNRLLYSTTGDSFVLRFSSALVHLRLEAIGTQCVLALRSPVLRGMPTGHRGELLDALNELNRATHFGKWALYDEEDLVSLEYDLLADQLQEVELMTAIATLARLADQQDDVLQRRFGGLRAKDQN